MSEKRDRDPWDDRYGSGDAVDDDLEDIPDAEGADTSKSAKTSGAEESEESTGGSKTGDSEGAVRERTNVNMYLLDPLVEDLQLRYSELNVEWRRQYSEDLPKNDEFYPAVVDAALEGTTIREQLPLDD